jgi:hypothetical protein
MGAASTTQRLHVQLRINPETYDCLLLNGLGVSSILQSSTMLRFCKERIVSRRRRYDYLVPRWCRQPVSEETEGVAPVANGGAVTKDSGRQDVTKEGHLPTLYRSLLTPNEVATCDSKYWTCPGANNLKVGVKASTVYRWFITSGRCYIRNCRKPKHFVTCQLRVFGLEVCVTAGIGWFFPVLSASFV